MRYIIIMRTCRGIVRCCWLKFYRRPRSVLAFYLNEEKLTFRLLHGTCWKNTGITFSVRKHFLGTLSRKTIWIFKMHPLYYGRSEMLTTYASIKVIHQLVFSVGCSFTSFCWTWIGAWRWRSVLVFGSGDHQSLAVWPVALQSWTRGGGCGGACLTVQRAGALLVHHRYISYAEYLNYKRAVIELRQQSCRCRCLHCSYLRESWPPGQEYR